MGDRFYDNLLLAPPNWTQGDEFGLQDHYPSHIRIVLLRQLHTNVTSILPTPYHFISYPIPNVFSRAQKEA